MLKEATKPLARAGKKVLRKKIKNVIITYTGMSLFNKKEEKANKRRAEEFFKEYTELSDRYGLTFAAILDITLQGIKPKLTIIAREKNEEENEPKRS